MRGYLYILIFLIAFSIPIHSQELWSVPNEDGKKISPALFTDEMKQEGATIYENACVSCHGNPGMQNYAKLSPSPGDVGSDKFQNQSDGSLFYKIRKGRGVMPSFENNFSEEETWNLIAYLRQTNKNYVQATPVATGEKMALLNAKLGYDDNVQKLVVKVTADSLPEAGIKVAAYVKSSFGMYALKKESTNKLGIAYIEIDHDLPADSTGKMVFYAKISKGASTLKVTDTLLVAEPRIITSVIDGRHLWSTSENAPIWLKVIFWSSLITIWGTIIYIVFGLLRINKLK